MNRTPLYRRAAPVACAVGLALTLGACAAANESAADVSADDLNGTLNGAGASSQQAAMQAWQAGFQKKHPGVTVNYDPIGSGGGREQFIAGAVPFAGSDAYLDEGELAQAQQRCAPGGVLEIPVYISPIAVIHHLRGVDDLRLSPDTLAGIFAGDIRWWNNPAIARDNPGVDLPSQPITPVHRSDESGTTENFLDYLSQAAGGAWPHAVSGNWPVPGGEAAKGTSGVVSAVRHGEGTIGYADASQAGGLDVARIEVGDEYVEYSPRAAAALLDSSSRVPNRPRGDLALNLDRTTGDSGVYPIALVSYQFACTRYDSAVTAKLVRAFITYEASKAGQRLAAEHAGSAPMSADLRRQAMHAIDMIDAKG